MSAVAELGINAAGFLSGIALAKNSLVGFGMVGDAIAARDPLPTNKITKAAAIITAGVTVAIAALAQGTAAAIKFGSSLVDLSYNAGLSTKQTMALQLSAERYGISSSAMTDATMKFNASAKDAANGTGPLVGILASAGVSMESFASMDVAQRMQTVAVAIKAIKHPTEQAQSAVAAFGAEGVKLNEALQPANLNSAAVALGTQAKLMEENAGVFARISQVMAQSGSTLAEITANAKAKIQGFFVGMASELAPEILNILSSVSTGSKSISTAIKEFVPALSPLVDVVDTLLKMDFAKLGQNLGKEIAIAYQTIKGVKFKDLLTNKEGISGAFQQTYEKTKTALFPTQGEGESKATGLQGLKDRILNAKKAIADGAQTIGDKAATEFETAKAKIAEAVKNAEKTVETTKAEARQQFATPVAREQILKPKEVSPLAPSAGPSQNGFDFVSSLTKVGGNMFGPSTAGQDPAAIGKQQLQATETTNEKINQTNLLLKILSEKKGSLVYG